MPLVKHWSLCYDQGANFVPNCAPGLLQTDPLLHLEPKHSLVFFLLWSTCSWPNINSIWQNDTTLSPEQLAVCTTKLLFRINQLRNFGNGAVYILTWSLPSLSQGPSWNLYRVVKWWNCSKPAAKYILWKIYLERRNPTSEISDMNNMECISYYFLQFQEKQGRISTVRYRLSVEQNLNFPLQKYKDISPYISNFKNKYFLSIVRGAGRD